VSSLPKTRMRNTFLKAQHLGLLPLGQPAFPTLFELYTDYDSWDRAIDSALAREFNGMLDTTCLSPSNQKLETYALVRIPFSRARVGRVAPFLACATVPTSPSTARVMRLVAQFRSGHSLLRGDCGAFRAPFSCPLCSAPREDLVHFLFVCPRLLAPQRSLFHAVRESVPRYHFVSSFPLLPLYYSTFIRIILGGSLPSVVMLPTSLDCCSTSALVSTVWPPLLHLWTSRGALLPQDSEEGPAPQL